MKHPSLLGILLLLASALCAFATGQPRITSAAWSDPSQAPRYNIAEPEIAVIGNYLDKVDRCSLVSVANNEVWPLEGVQGTFTRLTARVPKADQTRLAIPPGQYKVRLTAGTQVVDSVHRVVLSGMSVAAYTGKAPHDRPVIHMRLSIPTGFPVQLGQSLLVDAQGNRWKVASVMTEHAEEVLKWDAIPAGEYDLLLLALHGREFRVAWHSPIKFRAFATPTAGEGRPPSSPAPRLPEGVRQGEKKGHP